VRYILAATVLLAACSESPVEYLEVCYLEVSTIEVVGLGEFWTIADTTEVCE